MYVFNASGITRAKGKRIVSITSYRRRLFHDRINLAGGCKGLLDGLVRAGGLVDDSIKWLDDHYYQYTTADSPAGKGTPCTVIEVSDA